MTQLSNVPMQPTDAVEKLEHLEKEFLNKERDNTSSIMTLIASATANGVSKAINIVKEHKCIWKGVYNYSQESTHYTLSCGNEYFDNYMGEDVDIFKYCPYCGGEIELDKRYFDIAVNRTAFGEPEPRCNSVYDYYGVE